MRRLVLLCFVFMSAVPATAQNPWNPKSLPEGYQVLLDNVNTNDANEFVNNWINARKATIEKVEERISLLGKSLELNDYNYDKAISKYLVGGARVESGIYLNSSRAIIYIAGLGNVKQRQEFIQGMYYIAYQDEQIVEALDPQKPSSWVRLDNWAKGRASFAMNVVVRKRYKLGTQYSHAVIAKAWDKPRQNEVNGLEIVYVLEFWETVPSMYGVFPQFSSPSQHTLTPGRYVFWCRDKNNNGTRKPQNISASTTVDLDAP